MPIYTHHLQPQNKHTKVDRSGQKRPCLEVVATKQAQNKIYGVVWYGVPCFVTSSRRNVITMYVVVSRDFGDRESSLLPQETSCARTEEAVWQLASPFDQNRNPPRMSLRSHLHDTAATSKSLSDACVQAARQ